MEVQGTPLPQVVEKHMTSSSSVEHISNPIPKKIEDSKTSDGDAPSQRKRKKKSKPKLNSESVISKMDTVKTDKRYKTASSSKVTMRFLLLASAILITGIGAFYTVHSILGPKIKARMDINLYRSALESKVIGQDAAIAEILRMLPVLYQNAMKGELQVILLSGGNGVGKDLVAQVLTSEFYAQSGGDCQGSSFLLLNNREPVCKRTDLNVIRLDTISNDDVDILEAAELIHHLSRQEIRGVLFVPVLAAKAMDAGASGLQDIKTIEGYKAMIKRRSVEIQGLLRHHGVNSNVIVFEPVSRDVLVKCLNFPGDNVVNYVMEDREFSLSGCKNLDEFSMID